MAKCGLGFVQVRSCGWCKKQQGGVGCSFPPSLTSAHQQPLTLTASGLQLTIAHLNPVSIIAVNAPSSLLGRSSYLVFRKKSQVYTEHSCSTAPGQQERLSAVESQCWHWCLYCRMSFTNRIQVAFTTVSSKGTEDYATMLSHPCWF